jgi:argininosuccinate lyase
MSDALSVSMLSTDIAYYLVKRGVPFRRAHHISGEVVALAERKKKVLSELSLDELKSVSDVFSVDVKELWRFESSVEQYDVPGGTSKRSVVQQIQRLKESLAADDRERRDLAYPIA